MPLATAPSFLPLFRILSFVAEPVRLRLALRREPPYLMLTRSNSAACLAANSSSSCRIRSAVAEPSRTCACSSRSLDNLVLYSVVIIICSRACSPAPTSDVNHHSALCAAVRACGMRACVETLSSSTETWSISGPRDAGRECRCFMPRTSLIITSRQRQKSVLSLSIRNPVDSTSNRHQSCLLPPLPDSHASTRKRRRKKRRSWEGEEEEERYPKKRRSSLLTLALRSASAASAIAAGTCVSPSPQTRQRNTANNTHNPQHLPGVSNHSSLLYFRAGKQR